MSNNTLLIKLLYFFDIKSIFIMWGMEDLIAQNRKHFFTITEKQLDEKYQ
jgi:hypothetical protein